MTLGFAFAAWFTVPFGSTRYVLPALPGAFLLAAGEKGMRRALPHSRMMIHQPLGGYQGQATDIEIHARETIKLKTKLNEILAERTGQSVDTIQSDTERDKFLTADEAKDYGIIDEVIQPRKKG